MNTFKRLTIYMLILLAATQSGCKKKEEDPAPAAAIDPNAPLFENGSFVKGTITTTTSENEAVTFSFNYASLVVYPEYDTINNWMVCGMFSGIRGWYENERLVINIEVDSLEDPAPKSLSLDIYATIPLSGNKFFRFSFINTPPQPIIFSNYVYDAAANSASGDYTVTSTNTGNGNTATITGSFKIVGVREYVNRKGLIK